MTSQLKVDKLQGRTTAGSITVTSEGTSVETNLQQGLCKHWIRHDDGATVNDSFNNASLTDGGTGDYTATITNDFSNALYASSVTAGGTSGGAGDDCFGGNATSAAGSIKMYARDDGGSRKDSELSCIMCFGDLA